jgi:hypothetical protein
MQDIYVKPKTVAFSDTYAKASGGSTLAKSFTAVGYKTKAFEIQNTNLSHEVQYYINAQLVSGGGMTTVKTSTAVIPNSSGIYTDTTYIPYGIYNVYVGTTSAFVIVTGTINIVATAL